MKIISKIITLFLLVILIANIPVFVQGIPPNQPIYETYVFTLTPGDTIQIPNTDKEIKLKLIVPKEQIGYFVKGEPNPSFVDCSETDNGLDYFVKGTTQFRIIRDNQEVGTVTSTDTCNDANTLTEYSCALRETQFTCLNGCLNGACNPIEVEYVVVLDVYRVSNDVKTILESNLVLEEGSEKRIEEIKIKPTSIAPNQAMIRVAVGADTVIVEPEPIGPVKIGRIIEGGIAGRILTLKVGETATIPDTDKEINLVRIERLLSIQTSSETPYLAVFDIFKTMGDLKLLVNDDLMIGKDSLASIENIAISVRNIYPESNSVEIMVITSNYARQPVGYDITGRGVTLTLKVGETVQVPQYYGPNRGMTDKQISLIGLVGREHFSNLKAGETPYYVAQLDVYKTLNGDRLLLEDNLELGEDQVKQVEDITIIVKEIDAQNVLVTMYVITAPNTDREISGVGSTVIKTEIIDEGVIKPISIRVGGVNQMLVEVNNVIASTSESVQVRENQLYIDKGVEKKQVKIMPDVASERAIGIAKLHYINGIELKDVGKPTYYVDGNRNVRILALIPARMNVEANVDATNGEVVITDTPWWRFLAVTSAK